MLIDDNRGPGDFQSIFGRLRGKRYFTSIAPASGVFQLDIAEEDKHETAFRDEDGLLW